MLHDNTSQIKEMLKCQSNILNARSTIMPPVKNCTTQSFAPLSGTTIPALKNARRTRPLRNPLLPGTPPAPEPFFLLVRSHHQPVPGMNVAFSGQFVQP